MIFMAETSHEIAELFCVEIHLENYLNLAKKTVIYPW